MILEIHDSTTIEDLQDRFSAFYNNLKLEFYPGPHSWNEGSYNQVPFSPDRKLGDIRRKHEHGEWEIHSDWKTGEIEEVFRKKYGLNVQVLKCENGTWRQSTDSDKLTLEELNRSGA